MKSEYQNTIITRLKNLREKKGYSQAAIAKLLDISTGQLGNIESYKCSHKYTLKQIAMICDELDTNIENIFLDVSADSHISPRMVIDKIIDYQNK